MSQLRALFSNLFIALAMDILYVFPPLVSLASLSSQLVQALLSQILNQDVLPLDVGALVVHCAVAAVREALTTFEVGVAAGTGPGHDVRRELWQVVS